MNGKCQRKTDGEPCKTEQGASALLIPCLNLLLPFLKKEKGIVHRRQNKDHSEFLRK